jgi:hypothetical protein
MAKLVKTKIRNRKQKNRKSKTQKKTLKGGINYLIGHEGIDQNGNVYGRSLTNKFAVLQPTTDNKTSLPILHITNLDMVSIFPNNDDNYMYHTFFIAQIDKNVTGELDTINWTIAKLVNELLSKLNKNNENDPNNPNKVKYDLKNIKINDFKFEIKNEINVITISGNVYISNFNKINKQINNSVYNKLPDDTNNVIKGYI